MHSREPENGPMAQYRAKTLETGGARCQEPALDLLEFKSVMMNVMIYVLLEWHAYLQIVVVPYLNPCRIRSIVYVCAYRCIVVPKE